MKRRTLVITLVVDEANAASALAAVDIAVDRLDKIYHFHSADIEYKKDNREASNGAANIG